MHGGWLVGVGFLISCEIIILLDDVDDISYKAGPQQHHYTTSSSPILLFSGDRVVPTTRAWSLICIQNHHSFRLCPLRIEEGTCLEMGILIFHFCSARVSISTGLSKKLDVPVSSDDYYMVPVFLVTSSGQ